MIDGDSEILFVETLNNATEISTSLKVIEEGNQIQVKRYRVQYSVSDYTFPQDALIHRVHIDDEYLHVELTDGRVLAIPLQWIPTVYNATSADREKYEISRDRTMLIWDPNKCGINDEVRIADYFGPVRANTDDE
ncbi:MAG: DUF2442 domain-containing protein [Chloroflexi bacterium]|nr:DUF2442 domain-containing protein [Chloroflexota bacterium]